MKISEIFSQFKNIKPDPLYAEKSKRVVLASPQTPANVRERGIMVFLRALETGVALVLAGFFIMLATGTFNGSPLAPVQYSVIDPNGLHAEAQAIDIQIQLANLDYSEVPPAASGATTTVLPAAAIAAFRAAGVGAATSSPSSSASAAASSSATSTSATSTDLSVDQALQALSQ